MPSELLYQILARCEPSDLGRLSKVNRSLHEYIRDAAQLWKEVYTNRWDTYTGEIEDHLVNLGCPSTSSVTIPNPEQKAVRKMNKTPFNHAKQVKRRTWAEKRLTALQNRPIDLYANYNETLRALIAVARSRSLRNHSKSESDSEEELCLSAEYLTNLLTSPESIDIFRKIVYPRADVKLIRQWQLKNLSEQREKLKGVLKREEKRARSTSSGSPNTTKRSKRSHSIQGENEGSSSTDTMTPASLFSPPKRRSARVQLHAYPTGLHHLLYDREGNNLITLDDGTGLANLEALELVDEQLAAQLHVLHGIHPGFRPSNEKRTNNRTTSRTESDDFDFSDHGSIPEEEEDEEVSDTHDEEEDDQDEMHNNIFRFFINQMDINRRPREPALGSDLGHQGNLQLRGRAREIVYDTARYGVENSFGPLRAWRERYIGIDGPRIRSAQDWEDEEDEEWQGEWILDARDLEENFEVISEGEHESEGPLSGEEDEEGAIQEALAEGEDEEADPDFVGHRLDQADEEEEEEEDDEDDDDDDETEALFGIRALAISMSRGCLPWAEAAQISGKMNKGRGQQDHTYDEDDLRSVWRMEKRVDWVILESIMIVMYCNIRHAVLNHTWGKSFRLPGFEKSLVGRDRFARQIYLENEQSRNSYNPDEAWRNVLGLPVGWNHTRGTSDARSPADTPNNKQKPFDWAHVESTWIGTYAFLDWTKWASFNARDPISRGLPDPRLHHHSEAPDVGPFPYGHNQGSPSLEGEREALGDCLQLRLELLPMDEQKPFNETDRYDTFFEGYDAQLTHTFDGRSLDSEGKYSTCQLFQRRNDYPILRFRGHTRTYIDEGEPIPRGECYGSVRPIYETDDDDPDLAKKKADRVKDLDNANRSIVALHWEITHRYDGEDAWSLSGVQAGPPGTQAPIYGIWGSAQRRDNMSPCGPFAYYRVDDRRWKDLDEQRQQNRSSV